MCEVMSFSAWVLENRDALREADIEPLVCDCCGSRTEVTDADVSRVVDLIGGAWRSASSMSRLETYIWDELESRYALAVELDRRKLREWVGGAA